MSPERSWLTPFLGVALVALGLGGWLSGSSMRREIRVVSGNLPVNAGATDLRDINANNSPSLARNPADPANLAVANRIDSPTFSCALHLSFDAGASWSSAPIPFPAGEEAPPRCFAPDVSFGADGTMYVSFVTLKGAGNVPSAAWISSSKDGGRNLSPPTRTLGPHAFQVRLTADPTRPGRLYLSWLQAQGVATLAFPDVGNPINVVRSDDGGATWQVPQRVSHPARQRVVAPSLAIGPGDHVFVLYLDVGEDSLDYHGAHQGRGGPPYPGPWTLVLARSSDAGVSWNESVVDQRVVPTERFVVFLPPSPSLAVDQRQGRVYVAFHDGRLGDADVWLWTSDDGGTTFSPARRVNDSRRGDSTSQYLPKLSLSDEGRLDVVYYDRRADPANVHNEVSFQTSLDRGRTFLPRLRLSDRSFSSRVGFGSERGLPDLGSRLAVLSSERRSLAVWTDTRAGTEASNKQDLGRAVVAFSEPSWLRAPLRLGGPVLGGIGILLLGSLALNRKRPAPAERRPEAEPVAG